MERDGNEREPGAPGRPEIFLPTDAREDMKIIDAIFAGLVISEGFGKL
jgi:hypothetical protein